MIPKLLRTPGFRKPEPNDDDMVSALAVRERERDAAEAARAAAELCYRNLFASHPHAMWIFDPATLQFLDVNEAALRQYGFSRAEFLNMRVTEIRPVEDVPRLEAALRDLRLPSQSHPGFRHRRKNGRIIYVDITTHLLTFNGRAAVLVVSEDVTERRHAALQEADRHRATSLLASLGAALNLRRETDDVLQACADAIVQHIPGSCALIWTCYPGRPATMLEGFAFGCRSAQSRHLVRFPLTVADQTHGMLVVLLSEAVPELLHGTLASVADHIAQALARHAAEAARRFLADIVQDSDDAIVGTTSDGCIVSWNRGAENLSGYSASEAVGQSVSLIVLPEREGERRALFEQLMAGRHFSHYQTALRRVDGSQVHVSLTLSPVRDDHGTVVGASVVARDISERLQAERLLRETEERMRFALEVSKVGIWEADLKNDTAYWSPTCEALHGLAPGGFGRNFASFTDTVHPDDRDLVRHAMESGLTSPIEFEVEYRTIWPGGDEHWIRSTARFTFDVDGRPLRGAGIAIDITERRRLEDQFRQAQKMEAIGRLAGGVAHDFNNLLTAIVGYTELLTATCADQPPVVADLEEIRKAAGSAARLTRQLLTFSRKQILQPQALNLNESVTRAEALLRRTIGEDVALHPRLDDALWPIVADPGQIEQIVMNLAVNARDAMPKGGQLIIETKNVDLTDPVAARYYGLSAGPHVLLAVRDTGTGMDDAVRARIFEPFFTTKPEGQGTGLGLATVYGIVKQSGGAISVDSDLGRGTSFTILLPAARAEAGGSESGPELASTPGTETILVVEDQETVRDIVRRALTSHGYAVVEARDGTEALEILRGKEGPIHLVLSDVVMPGMSGFRLADTLAQAYPEVRVMLMSGYPEEALRQGEVFEPEVLFLQKPFSPDMIRTAVRKVLDQGTGSLAVR